MSPLAAQVESVCPWLGFPSNTDYEVRQLSIPPQSTEERNKLRALSTGWEELERGGITSDRNYQGKRVTKKWSQDSGVTRFVTQIMSFVPDFF